MGNILELAGFVIRSSYRKKVFTMFEKPIRPSEMAKRLDIRLTHVTRELRALKSRGLIECLNPKERTGRLYQLTAKGKRLKKEMISEGLL
jgi:DNA-binding MarR family transcriptional regulator